MNLYQRSKTNCRKVLPINYEEYEANTSLESTIINLALSQNVFNIIYAFSLPI